MTGPEPKQEPTDLTDTPVLETIDVRHLEPDLGIELREASPYSPQWARIAKPIALSFLAIIATVILLPFLIISWGDKCRTDDVLDWAKSVLPPVVGFGGALVGYYFGSRHGHPSQSSEEQSEIK